MISVVAVKSNAYDRVKDGTKNNAGKWYTYELASSEISHKI
jgi:hypothetical protein